MRLDADVVGLAEGGLGGDGVDVAPVELKHRHAEHLLAALAEVCVTAGVEHGLHQRVHAHRPRHRHVHPPAAAT